MEPRWVWVSKIRKFQTDPFKFKEGLVVGGLSEWSKVQIILFRARWGIGHVMISVGLQAKQRVRIGYN